MSRLKSAIKFVAECFVISLIIAVVDFLVVFLFMRDPNSVIFYLSMALLLEGGLGLLVGGITASFSRLINKIGERFNRSKPWDTTSQKDSERKAIPWIVTGSILVLLSFVVSAF